MCLSHSPPKYQTIVMCAGFAWHRVNLLHNSWDGVVVWVCVENSVDDTAIFLLLLSRAYPQSRHFLLLTPPPTVRN